MKYVYINDFNYLSQDVPLGELNYLVLIHDSLMPHQIASATGCQIEEAIKLLTMLMLRHLAIGYLLVYHATICIDPPAPILERLLVDGPPNLPMVCENCGNEITSLSELLFDYSYKLTDQLRFIKRSDAIHVV